MNTNETDLQRFLQEVGTDAKEARYWLKYFQRTTAEDSRRPFAVIHVENDVIGCQEILDNLCSCLAFLHRHNMNMVLVHGPDTRIHTSSSDQSHVLHCCKELRRDELLIVDALERNNARVRPLFYGASIFSLCASPQECQLRSNSSNDADRSHEPIYQTVSHPKTTTCDNDMSLTCDDRSLIFDMSLKCDDTCVRWALTSRHITVVSSVAETHDGRLVVIDVMHATSLLARTLKPLKVLFLNDRGGLLDETGQVIANINIPGDLSTTFSNPWCTEDVACKVKDIAELLSHLPAQSSVIISSAKRLLAELFTHQGSGTFFKITAGIYSVSSFDELDTDLLINLIERGFNKTLDVVYLDKLRQRFHTAYIVDGYLGSAIITREEGIDVPYLDKFVVCSTRQGENSGKMLWDTISRNFSQLFWRSLRTNPINSWYFQRCEGSRCVGRWTVFWFGSIADETTTRLVEYAKNLPASFVTTSTIMATSTTAT